MISPLQYANQQLAVHGLHTQAKHLNNEKNVFIATYENKGLQIVSQPIIQEQETRKINSLFVYGEDYPTACKIRDLLENQGLYISELAVFEDKNSCHIPLSGNSVIFPK